jgi:hypothetical protein
MTGGLCTGGLVQHDDRRLVHQRLRHQHPALHAARELAHVGRGLVGQAQALQQLVDPGLVVLDAEVARLDAQRFAHIEEGVEHQLLRHDAELAPGLGIVALHVEAMDADGAGRGARQAGEHADERGLACAIGPEQAEELARLDLEADLVDGAQPLLALGPLLSGGRVGLGDRLE